MKRAYEIKIRFTSGELETLNKKVEKSGLSREKYCRMVLNGSQVKSAPPVDVPMLIRELYRVVMKLNQILETKEVPCPQELRKVMKETHGVVGVIVDAYAQEK